MNRINNNQIKSHSHMFPETIKNLKSYLKKKIDNFFPNLRWAAVLIVFPAVVIVPIYFYSILSEIITKPEVDPVVVYENRFAPLKKDLPAGAVFNYVTDQKLLKDVILARYVLVPARMVRGLEPKQNHLVVSHMETAGVPHFDGFTLKKNYGNGVMLFKRRP